MSRNATPLLVASPLLDLAGGAEILIVETRLAHPYPSEAGSHEEEHSLCVLALVNPDHDARRLLRSEAARYVSASARVESLIGPDWGHQLVGLLDATEPAFVDLVVGWPTLEQDAWRQVTESVDSVRAAGRHQFCTGVVVNGQPMPWIRHAHDMRFVAVEGMSAQQGAIWLHAALAQLSAPRMVECVSSEEVDGVFGSPTQPARLHLTDAERLPGLIHEIRAHDGTAVTAHAAAFFLDGVGLRGYSAAARTLRAAGTDASVVVAPDGLTLAGAPGSAARCVLVVSAAEDSATVGADEE